MSWHYIPREKEKILRKYIGKGKKQAVALIGPRQAGKTTLLKKIQKELRKQKTAFLTFENQEDRVLFAENIEGFKKLYGNYDVIFIDEFQYAKDGGQKLKYLYDTTKAQFVVSSSSSLDLTFQTGKFIVGRLLTFTLLPFSFRESLKESLSEIIPKPATFDQLPHIKPLGPMLDDKVRAAFEEYLTFGGYPNIILSQESKDKIFQLRSLYDTYFLREIESLLKLATESELRQLLKALALQIGNLIEYRELSQVTGLKHGALKKHCNILSATYLTEFLSPYFTNRRTELVKSSKIYFLDTGFRNFVVNDFRELDIRQDTGALVENYILKRLHEYANINEEIHFWRTKNKAEVDFVFIAGNEIIPIEVKYRINPSVGKSLYSFIEKYKPSKAFILTKSTFQKIKIQRTHVYFLPVYYF